MSEKKKNIQQQRKARRAVAAKKAHAQQASLEQIKRKQNKRLAKVAKRQGDQIIYSVPMKKGVDQIAVKASLNPFSPQEMMACFTSYFLSCDFPSMPQVDMPTFYNGMLYMWQNFLLEITGKPSLATRPQIVHDLIKAFSQKKISFHGKGSLSFSWQNTTPLTTGNYYTGWSNWNFIINDPDDTTYNTPASVYIPGTPTEDDYSAFLENIQGVSNLKSRLLKVVDSDASSVLERDVSAFSKTYSYNGLEPARSGASYNSVENEGPIDCPIIAHNVSYPGGTEDDRCPKKLTITAGGPAFNLFPLVPSFESWFNTVPPVIKYIDFFEIVNTILYWYINAVRCKQADIGLDVSAYQFDFTYQDFLIMIRQALLSTVFTEQYMVQFIGPLKYTSGPQNTNFVPFQILGNCYGTDKQGAVLIPNILRENLSALKCQSISYGAPKSKIKKVVYIPVLGYYRGDIQPVWQIDAGGEAPYPLFKTAPDIVQMEIDLVNCFDGENYINVTGRYYGTVQEKWNETILKLKTETNVSTMKTVCPPKNSMLMQVTRTIDYIPPDTNLNRKLGGKTFEYPALKYIANVSYKMPVPTAKELSKKSQGKNVTLPQAATIANLTIKGLYSSYPLSEDLYSLIRYMVVPSIRLDPNSSNDKLTNSMYQIETNEVIYYPAENNSAEPDYVGRQNETGEMFVQGFAKTANSDFDQIFEQLSSKGQAGALASILGGVAKMIFPSASGLIDQVSTVIPI